MVSADGKRSTSHGQTNKDEEKKRVKNAKFSKSLDTLIQRCDDLLDPKGDNSSQRETSSSRERWEGFELAVDGGTIGIFDPVTNSPDSESYADGGIARLNSAAEVLIHLDDGVYKILLREDDEKPHTRAKVEEYHLDVESGEVAVSSGMESRSFQVAKGRRRVRIWNEGGGIMVQLSDPVSGGSVLAREQVPRLIFSS